MISAAGLGLHYQCFCNSSGTHWNTVEHIAALKQLMENYRIGSFNYKQAMA